MMIPRMIAIMFLAATLVGCGWSVDARLNPDTRYPETELKGWGLDESNTGLRGDYSGLTALADIDAIGYLGTTEGPLFITRSVTLENRTIPYEIVVETRGVVISNCLVRPAAVGMGMPLVSAGDARILDCEIDGSLIPDGNIVMSIAYSGTGFIERCNIHHAASGILINNISDRISVAQGNYIHHLRWISPAHMDGITTRASRGGGVIIRNNRSVCDSTEGVTGALFLQPFSGYIDRVCIKGNLLEGNGYTLCIDNHGAGYGYAIYIENNRMNPSGFGAFAMSPGVRLAEFSGNYLYDPGAEDGMGGLLNY